MWREDDTFSLLTVNVSLFKEPGLYSTQATLQFALAGRLVWNSLPANIRSASISLQTFAARLKTYLHCRERN